MRHLSKLQDAFAPAPESPPIETYLISQFPELELDQLRQAETAFATKDWETAASLWQQLIDSYTPKAHTRLAQIYRAQGQQSKASNHLEQALPLLQQIASELPSMGGNRIGQELRQAAGNCRPGQAIVEVGSWLGSGTAHLALGLLENGQQNLLHVYDKWQARVSEAEKAANAGAVIQAGQDTLPMVRSFLDPFGTEIVFHKGDILKLDWTGPNIGLYVDDAAKFPRTFLHMLRTFSPYWVPGETRLVLQDYSYYEKYPRVPIFQVQKSLIENSPQCFEQVADHVGKTSCAIFDYVSPLPDNAIAELAHEYRFAQYAPVELLYKLMIWSRLG